MKNVRIYQFHQIKLRIWINIAKDGVLRTSNEILTQKGVDMKKIREIWPDIPFFRKK